MTKVFFVLTLALIMAYGAYDCDAALFYFRVARGTDAPSKVISQKKILLFDYFFSKIISF